MRTMVGRARAEAMRNGLVRVSMRGSGLVALFDASGEPFDGTAQALRGDAFAAARDAARAEAERAWGEREVV
ncbi:hypothetical protein ER308_07100 [Egibacter rhizosphaerae]|uniref:Uncharacterized protein n=1 Tax=Egibacter rhizosphaerae TaxID=1670831 RepID=A0A411YDN3_9ACTN|nr:hypothetical protein [Egibacter rhizosphaerae]QBI19333.1 hypothetical protein ER308_07100 [Egibacter rhizosphaerae]